MSRLSARSNCPFCFKIVWTLDNFQIVNTVWTLFSSTGSSLTAMMRHCVAGALRPEWNGASKG